MTILAMLPLLLFACFNSILYPRIPEMVRIAGSLFGIFLLFLATAVMVVVPITPFVFFAVTMTVIWFINSFSAILQGSLFGLIGQLPEKYSSLFMSGQGVAGIFASLASIFAKISDSDQESAALGYFITPCLVILMTLIFYFVLLHLEFAKYHFSKDHKHRNELECKSVLLSPTDEKNGEIGARKQAFVSVEGSSSSDDQPEKALGIIKVLAKIWKMAISVCLILMVTLTVFPAIAVDVNSHVVEGKWSEYFIYVCCFLLFNIMDCLGRSMTAYCMRPRKDNLLMPLILLRVVFIPLFMLCNVKDRKFLPVIFHHDCWFIAFIVALAFSNGYLATICMCYAPKRVSPKDAETAGAIMSFFFSLGLALGAGLSFLVRLMI
ncbi:equilibrative nucleoside transporter 2-like isoform X2 [Heptranchias perlo]